jgi:signal transduction histidine kinase/CheY-like chemotaxis protein
MSKRPELNAQTKPALASVPLGELGRKQQVSDELVRSLFDQAPTGLVVTALNGLLVTGAVAHFYEVGLAWSWFGILLVILLLRGLTIARFRQDQSRLSMTVWSRWFMVGAAATGACWGFSVYMLPWESFTDEVFLSFVIAGMVAGAVPSLSPRLRVYVVYLAMALVPLSVRMVLIGGDFALTFLALIILFGIFMLVSARAHNHSLRSSLELRDANADLVAKLTEESRRVKRLNARLTREIAQRERIEHDLRIAKEQAEGASVAKSEFVANMSHEIRTPMNGVLGMIELLSQSVLNSQQRGFLEIARTSSESLLNVINSILDFSKIEAGKLELESVPFDVRAIAEDVAALFTANAQSAELELVCFVAPDVHTRVRGDPTRLRQILTNLLGNAIKFTEHGEVALRVHEISRYGDAVMLEFEVRDSGIGMSREQMQRLFEPFQQADGSMTRRFGGSGLGLAITKQLTELMGGTIDFQSELGKGALFVVRIPFLLQPSEPLAADSASLDGCRVLIVDDNATNREILAHYLRGWGIEPQQAASAEQALALMHAAVGLGRPFDAALLDLQMPGTDGRELAARIKADAVLAAIPLVLLSSVGNTTLPDGAQADFALSLTKPVRYGLLRDALFQVIHGVTPAYARTQKPATDAGPALSGSVLMAEDNRVNQMVATSMLRAMGLDVDLAENGEEALRMSAAKRYRLILMDVQMPVMDGLAAARAVRELEQRAGLPPVPIIAITANAMTDDRQACLEAGMDDYLAKPFKRAQLREILARWMI